jgi:tRNA threonylcarbamoyladenosine biosynthesis protein TsaB
MVRPRLARVGVVLGFDTATAALTVAATDGGTTLAERDAEPDSAGRPRHASELLPAVEAVLGEAGGWERVSRIAVGVGPGTFTGLRIGIATARALAQARALEVVGVSSLAALAAGVEDDVADADRPRLAVLDAKRGEAFAALYERGGVEAWPAWVGSPEELAERVRGLSGSPVAVGEGSVRFRHQLEAVGALVPADGDPAHRLRAHHLCRLGAGMRAQGPEDIEPNYLRRPDAELWRERDHRPTNR